MSFSVTSPVEEDEGSISNIAFFPAVALSKARAIARIDGTVPTERLRQALVTGMLKINADLSDWIEAEKEAGNTTLADKEGLEIEEGINQHQHQYLRAVACYAKANLTERYRDHDSTNEGHDRADDLSATIDDLWRDYHWALSDLQGKPRATVALI